MQTLPGAGRSEEGRGLEGEAASQAKPGCNGNTGKVKKERTQPWVSRVRFKESRDWRLWPCQGTSVGDGGAKRGLKNCK